jgi:hypothetical protein
LRPNDGRVQQRDGEQQTGGDEESVHKVERAGVRVEELTRPVKP